MKDSKVERTRHKALMFGQQRVRRNHPAQIASLRYAQCALR
jgi:hypothetical protein